MGEQQHDVSAEAESNVSPTALSLVGGFVGTVSGLKRNGVPGAVLGGLVGGTVGYVSGASLNGDATSGPEIDTEPVSVTVADEENSGTDLKEDMGDADDEDDAAEDGDADVSEDGEGGEDDEDDEE